MPEPLEQAGGHVRWTTNMKATTALLNAIGQAPGVMMWDVLMGQLIAHDPDAGAGSFNANQTSFLHTGFGVIPSFVASDLDLTLLKGLGVVLDESEDDVFEPVLKPVVNPEDATISVSAQDATNERWDIVCIQPANADGEEDAVRIYNSATNSFSASNEDILRSPSYAVQVVEGTPAGSPSAPATPAGWTRIALVKVPATGSSVDGSGLPNDVIWVDDERTKAVIHPDLIGDGSITAAKQTRSPLCLLRTGLTSEVADKRSLSLRVCDHDGNFVTSSVNVLLELLDENMLPLVDTSEAQIETISIGTANSNVPEPNCRLTTNSFGQLTAVIEQLEPTSTLFFVKATVMSIDPTSAAPIVGDLVVSSPAYFSISFS